MGTICSSEIIHLKDGILDIRYGAGSKLSGEVDELEMFLHRNNLRPEEIVLTPAQFALLRTSALAKDADELMPSTPKEERRTYARITVRQLGHVQQFGH